MNLIVLHRSNWPYNILGKFDFCALLLVCRYRAILRRQNITSQTLGLYNILFKNGREKIVIKLSLPFKFQFGEQESIK
jgi:hypothetical protein